MCVYKRCIFNKTKHLSFLTLHPFWNENAFTPDTHERLSDRSSDKRYKEIFISIYLEKLATSFNKIKISLSKTKPRNESVR